MYDILSSYGFPYFQFHQSLVVRIFSYQHGDEAIIKDILLKKPILEKIQSTTLSKEDQQFQNLLKQLYPANPEGAFEEVMSVANLIGYLNPVYDLDD